MTEVVHKTQEKLQKNFLFKKQLGQGAFGAVFEVQPIRDRSDRHNRFASFKRSKNETYALKIILQEEIAGQTQFGVTLTDSDYEIAMMKKVAGPDAEQHPNIVNLVCYLTKDTLFPGSPNLLFLDYCPYGELYDILARPEIQSRTRKKEYVHQILSGLNFMHSKNIIHRDLKPQNIFVVNYSHIRIGDFGLSEKADKFGFVYGGSGTPFYYSSEMLAQIRDKHNGFVSTIKINKKYDVWAVGHICYNLLTGCEPFLNTKMQLNGHEGLDIENRPEAKENRLSRRAMRFVNNLLHKDPEERFDCDQALAASWLKHQTDLDEVDEGSNQLAKKMNEMNAKRKLSRMVEFAMTFARIKSFQQFASEKNAEGDTIRTVNTVRKRMRKPMNKKEFVISNRVLEAEKEIESNVSLKTVSERLNKFVFN